MSRHARLLPPSRRLRHQSPSPFNSEPRSQHFLRDRALADDLAIRLPLPPGSLVLEPGPGRGVITTALADRGFRVVAVEKDAALHRVLRSRMVGRTNVECHQADILEWPLPREPYAVASNVPFSITAALVRRLLAAPRPPELALLILQREAAERWAGPSETRVSLADRPWFEMRIDRWYRRADFDPPPPVECVLLRLQRREHPLIPRRFQPEWRQFVAATFGARKQEARDSLRLFFTERQIVRFAHDLGFARTARPSEIPFGAWLAMFRFHTQGRFAASPRTIAVLAGGASAGCSYRNRSRSAGRMSIDVTASSDCV